MKKGLAFTLTILGSLGLIFGVIMIFTGNVMQSTSWIAAVLGIIFFTSGIGLMKSTSSSS